MAETAVQVSVTVVGWAERARVARAFTAGDSIIPVEVTSRSGPGGAGDASRGPGSGSALRRS